jgi:L-aminopeptidase/D-esterase-like protein
MNFTLTTPDQLDKADINRLSYIAQAGFERIGDPSMHADTLQHIADAKILQVIESAGNPVAFSMYQRCLWQ